MDIRNRRAIHSRAAAAIAEAPSDPKKIALTYTLVSSVLALIYTLLSAFLTDRIDNTGGLGNMALRSILSTGQTILPLIQLIISSCLGLGYAMAVLRISRNEDARPQTLLDGFRHFGPMLRAVFFQALLYLSYGIISMYLSSFIFLATPFAEGFYAVMDPVMESVNAAGGELVVDESMMLAAGETLQPMIWIWLALFLLLFIPVFFSYRMVTFCIADNPRQGALRSLHESKLLMRRNRFALLKLDLSMWWFYGLQVLISLICYGDVLLPMIGIQLPFSSTVNYYLFFVLSLIVQVITYYFLMNRVNVAYAVAYETLKYEDEAEPEVLPQNLPFSTDYEA